VSLRHLFAAFLSLFVLFAVACDPLLPGQSGERCVRTDCSDRGQRCVVDKTRAFCE
jgi:hypothetical protein